jgi:hypothetical protein
MPEVKGKIGRLLCAIGLHKKYSNIEDTFYGGHKEHCKRCGKEREVWMPGSSTNAFGVSTQDILGGEKTKWKKPKS